MSDNPILDSRWRRTAERRDRAGEGLVGLWQDDVLTTGGSDHHRASPTEDQPPTRDTD